MINSTGLLPRHKNRGAVLKSSHTLRFDRRAVNLTYFMAVMFIYKNIICSPKLEIARRYIEEAHSFGFLSAQSYWV
jgi:hypothetical protein